MHEDIQNQSTDKPKHKHLQDEPSGRRGVLLPTWLISGFIPFLVGMAGFILTSTFANVAEQHTQNVSISILQDQMRQVQDAVKVQNDFRIHSLDFEDEVRTFEKQQRDDTVMLLAGQRKIEHLLGKHMGVQIPDIKVTLPTNRHIVSPTASLLGKHKFTREMVWIDHPVGSYDYWVRWREDNYAKEHYISICKTLGYDPPFGSHQIFKAVYYFDMGDCWDMSSKPSYDMLRNPDGSLVRSTFQLLEGKLIVAKE